MSSDSIFSSVESEKRWVLTMDKIFPQPQNILDNKHILNIDFDTPACSVFRVPKNLTEEKPEAYAPHHLGLGPYHHLRPDLYKTHHLKLSAIRNYLSPEKLQNFRLVVEALIPLDPIIRASYDHYLDLDIETLAWMLAIDALYLLQFLKNYPRGGKNLAGDIMMLENQIPVFLLNKIQQCLQLCPENDESLKEIESFLRDQSPLDWNPSATMEIGHMSHLLQCLYHMIVFEEPAFSPYSLPMTGITSEDIATGVQFLAERGFPGASIAGQILSLVNMIPWSKITGLFKKRRGVEPTPLANKIDVPSVSEMSKAAGIKFITTQGIRDIRFEESKKEFHLPVIRITTTSEVVLRNLMAYEEASSEPESTLLLAEYLDLMCGIIDCANDVKMLKKEKIIETKLGDEEIARVFNGISKSTRKSETKYKSNVEKAIDDVNKRYNNLASVKVKAFFEKYVYGLFKVLGVLISIVVLILLVLQAFCSVFGCTRWFSKTPVGNQVVILRGRNVNVI
ncbi:hypothetical protein ACS0TY_024192 [Phlomoides rotata]